LYLCGKFQKYGAGQKIYGYKFWTGIYCTIKCSLKVYRKSKNGTILVEFRKSCINYSTDKRIHRINNCGAKSIAEIENLISELNQKHNVNIFFGMDVRKYGLEVKKLLPVVLLTQETLEGDSTTKTIG
jgi:hypothetical protein